MMMARELLARNGLNVHQEDAQGANTPRILLRANSRPINGVVEELEKKTCC